MLGVNPVMFLVKLPVPLPEANLLLLVVGFCEVFQHIPRVVTEAPPVAVTLPPQVAVVDAMLETSLVVTVGGLVEFTFLTWSWKPGYVLSEEVALIDVNFIVMVLDEEIIGVEITPLFRTCVNSVLEVLFPS